LIIYFQVLSEATSRIVNPPRVKRKEDPQYLEAVKKIFSLLDDKEVEKAATIANEAGISVLEFEDLCTIHFWDWNN